MSEPSDTASQAPSGPKAFNALEVLRNIGAQLLVISDAQLAIWKMKLIRLAALALLAVPMALAFLALAVYGFVLLDQAAASAMKAAQWAEWVSPLVRGGVYTLGTSIVAVSFWRTHIGSVAAKK
ncbi:MAG: hypothetical protein WCT04_20390 [Planctomycetota bacterium]